YEPAGEMDLWYMPCVQGYPVLAPGVSKVLGHYEAFDARIYLLYN
ncbi:MAG: hypothetical protein UY56_C0005G0001, partial [Parcubacteria group bacterium GW2011_GWA1_50_14]